MAALAAGRDGVELLAAIKAQSDPLTPHDKRRHAHEVCEAFKRMPDSAERALMLLQATHPALDETAQHFAMHVLQLDIKYRWNTWTDAMRRHMRESVLQISSGQFQSKPRFLREMAARLLADIAQREFPQRWPDLMENMLALAGSGNEQAEIAWIMLALLAEDSSDADFNGAIPAGRRREVMQGLHALYPTLHCAAFALLEDQYGVCNRAHAAGAAPEILRGSGVLSAVLRFVESCAVWAQWPTPADGISGAEQLAIKSAEDVGGRSFILASATLMADTNLPEACRRHAWACLRALLSSSKFAAYATLTATPSRCDSTTAARAAHVLCSVAPALRRAVAALPLDPTEQPRWLEHAELLVVLSQYSHLEVVASAMSAPKPAVPLAAASSALQEVLQLALELTARHPSQLLVERLLAMWLALLRSGALRAFAEALLAALVPALLEALAGRLQLEGDPELSGQDGACDSCDWSAEHFADCAEWQIFWAQQLRPRLGLVLRLVARHHADAAAKFACNAAAKALARVSAAGTAHDARTSECSVVCALAMEIVGGIAPGSFNMVPVTADSGGDSSASPATESKVKERERRFRLVSMLGELLQDLCRLASNAIAVSDATALGRLVQCIGLFGPLLQQQQSLLPPVLELLFGALTFGEPSGLFASAPSPAVAAARLRHSLSPRAQASRRSAGKTLLRLCSVPRFSAVMEPYFGAFCGRTGELIRAQRLLAIERQTLQEALVAVSLGMGTHEQRAGFLDQVLAPVLVEWTSTEISADVSSANALLKSMVTCRKRADAAVGVDGTMAANTGTAGERLSPNWALLNALGSLLSVAKRTNAALLAGTSASPVGLTSAHWSHIMPNVVRAIAALHACWGDGSAAAAAGVSRQMLLQQRHARWLLGLSRDELMRLTGTESEAAAALLLATSGGSGGGGVSGFGDLTALGGSSRTGNAAVRPKPGWGCWDDSGWDEGACAGDGVDGDELASWATRCRTALYSLLGQACCSHKPDCLGFLLSSTAAPAPTAPGFQQPSPMLQQLHTVLIAHLPCMEHRHLRLLMLNFFIPFVGAASRCDRHEVWSSAMAPLIAPFLVHMNERLRIAWAAIAVCGEDRSGEGGSAALLAQGYGAWLPVLPTTNLDTGAARERLDRACERTLRELTRAYAQFLCVIFLPHANTASSPASASSPTAPRTSPELVSLGTGSGQGGISTSGERLTLPLCLVQSSDAPVIAMAEPICGAIAGLLGGDAWQCADSVAAARGAMLARQLLRLLGFGVTADISNSQMQLKLQTQMPMGVSETSGISEHSKTTQRLMPFLGQDLFLAALVPLLRRSPHVSGGSQNLQWEMLGLLKDIYVGLTVHSATDPGVCNMPRHVLMSVAHATEAEIASLDSALQSSRKHTPTVRDKEQKHCMRDWLAQLVLKRESLLHAAGVDVEGAEAHAAATGAAAGDSVLRERPSAVQNLHEPLVIKSKRNAKDASAWQNVADDLGTGNLFGDADSGL